MFCAFFPLSLLLVKHIRSFLDLPGVIFVVFVRMASKYVSIKEVDEKFEDVFPPGRTSTSLSESTLLDEEEQRTIQPQARSPKWMWITHAVLLGLSLTMFVSSWFARVSTLDHVREFSAYCMLPPAGVIILLILRSTSSKSSQVR